MDYQAEGGESDMLEFGCSDAGVDECAAGWFSWGGGVRRVELWFCRQGDYGWLAFCCCAGGAERRLPRTMRLAVWLSSKLTDKF